MDIPDWVVILVICIIVVAVAIPIAICAVRAFRDWLADAYIQMWVTAVRDQERETAAWASTRASTSADRAPGIESTGPSQQSSTYGSRSRPRRVLKHPGEPSRRSRARPAQADRDYLPDTPHP